MLHSKLRNILKLQTTGVIMVNLVFMSLIKWNTHTHTHRVYLRTNVITYHCIGHFSLLFPPPPTFGLPLGQCTETTGEVNLFINCMRVEQVRLENQTIRLRSSISRVSCRQKKKLKQFVWKGTGRGRVVLYFLVFWLKKEYGEDFKIF